MPTVTLPAGELHYRTAGPDHAADPPVVFVHGFLVDSTLWDGVADRLAAAGVRSYLVDWPLGSHRTPMAADAELSPVGVARMINQVLDRLGLDDVTLVGNDTGGAICQLLLADDPSRIGALVLTNCDAFEQFPPRWFKPLFALARYPMAAAALLAPTRWSWIRHSPLAFGKLMRRPRPKAVTAAWVRPARTDRRIRHDIARFMRYLDPQQLVAAAPALARFDGPVRLVWGTRDRCFTMRDRLAAAFQPPAPITEVPDATTFVSIDDPTAVAEAIRSVRSPG